MPPKKFAKTAATKYAGTKRKSTAVPPRRVRWQSMASRYRNTAPPASLAGQRRGRTGSFIFNQMDNFYPRRRSWRGAQNAPPPTPVAPVIAPHRPPYPTRRPSLPRVPLSDRRDSGFLDTGPIVPATTRRRSSTSDSGRPTQRRRTSSHALPPGPAAPSRRPSRRPSVFDINMQSMDDFSNDLPDYGALFDDIKPAGDGKPLFSWEDNSNAIAQAGYTAAANMRDSSYKPKPKDRTYLEWFGDKVAVPLGTAAGGAASTFLTGNPLTGMALGASAGELVRSVTGSGNYKMGPMNPKYNTIANSNTVPKFKTKGGSNIVSHREYIGEVTTGGVLSAGGTTNFNATRYAVQPADVGTMPWLAGLANQYEEYIIHGMIFEYKSSSGESTNTANTSLGTVIMGTQYNVNSAPFTNKQMMENYEYSNSCRPSDNMLHAVECSPSEQPFKMLFTRPFGINTLTQQLAGQDLRLYDLANFSIATQGMQTANQTIGELWVSYQIEFLKPKISASREPSYVGTANATGSNPFGNPSNILVNRGPLNIRFNPTMTTIQWEAQPLTRYKIMCTHRGGTASTGVTSQTAFQECGPTNALCSPTGLNTASFTNHGSGASFNVTAWEATVLTNAQLVSGLAGFTLATGIALPTNPFTDIWVYEIPRQIIPL